jgi:uncharacterized membrane protein (UPF0127 family)
MPTAMRTAERAAHQCRPARGGAVLLTVAAIAIVACSRTPAEEFPARSTTVPPDGIPSAAPSALVAPAVGSSRLAGRCLHATPAAPPPPVAPGPAPGCPADPEGGPPKVPVVGIGFSDGGLHIDAELVTSQHDTMRGLMYRTSLPEMRGMLFDLRAREDHEFWMHNTCIPLDLLFIDEDGLLVGIVENAPTLDDTSRGVGCPSRYVLEMNAGWSRRHGIRAGQFVTLP